MPTRRYDYRQTVIGECGHACSVWPLFHKLGERGNTVVCDECTREKYGLDFETQLPVYVRVEEPEPKPEPKTTKQRTPKVRCSMCRKTGHSYMECPLLFGQGSLLDG